MTTGMRNDETTVVETDRPRPLNWIVPLVVLVVVIGLLVWAITAGMQNSGTSGPNGSTTSVQNSATGQQGAVGQFPERLNNQPNTPKNSSPEQLNNPPGVGTLPPGTSGKTTGNGTAGNTGTNGNNVTPGAGSGAGSTGISTATDTMGGASVPSKGSTGSSNNNTGTGAESTNNHP